MTSYRIREPGRIERTTDPAQVIRRMRAAYRARHAMEATDDTGLVVAGVEFHVDVGDSSRWLWWYDRDLDIASGGEA